MDGGWFLQSGDGGSATARGCHPCYLYFPDEGVLIGDGSVTGYDDEITWELKVVERPEDNARPFLAFSMRLPRPNQVEAAFYDQIRGEFSSNFGITIKFLGGTFDILGEQLSSEDRERLARYKRNEDGDPTGYINTTALVRVAIRDGEEPLVEGVGNPLWGANPEADAYFNSNALIQGAKTLHEVISSRHFSFLVKDTSVLQILRSLQLPRASMPYDKYGTDHSWNLDRYKIQLPALKSRVEYPMAFRFDFPNDCHVSLTQGAVQDVFWLWKDVEEIRNIPIPFRFVQTEDMDVFLAFGRLPSHFHVKSSLCRALSRAMKPQFPVGLAFNQFLPENPDDGDSRREIPKDNLFWEAFLVDEPTSNDQSMRADLILEVRRPQNPREPRYRIRDQYIKAFRTFEIGRDFWQECYLKLDAGLNGARKRVRAVSHLFDVHPAVKENGVAGAHGQNGHGDNTPGDEEESIEKPGPNNFRQRALLKGFQRNFIQGVGFSNALQDASRQFAELDVDDRPTHCPPIDLLHGIDGSVKDGILSRLLPETRGRFEVLMENTTLGLVGIFGFAGAGKTETAAVAAQCLVANPKIKTVYCAAATNVATDNFSARLDRLGSLVYSINANGMQHLPMVVRGYAFSSEVRCFLAIIDGNSNPNDRSPWRLELSLCEWTLKLVGFANFQLTSPKDAVRKLSLEFQTSTDYATLRQIVRGETQMKMVGALSKDLGKAQKTVRRQIVDLMKSLLACADAVCTTPYASDEQPFKEFKQKNARAVVLDEAGCMAKTDALIVWRDGTPCIMAGDPRQLPPTVMTLDEGVNPFAREARVSILEHYQRSGFPCLVLNEQLRIVRGGFDIVRDVIYPDVEGFRYGERTNLANHPKAIEVDQWVTKRFQITSPPGKIHPTFVNVSASHGLGCTQGRGSSRYNPTQNAVAIRIILDLLDETSIKPEDIAITTPYKKNETELKRALGTHRRTALKRVQVTTHDSFQGQERQVIINVTVVDANMGSPFVSDENRVCVGLSRHIGSLFIIGDIRTRTDGGSFHAWISKKHRDTFREVVEWFSNHGRIARWDE